MIKFSNNIEDYPEGIVLPIDKPYRWTSADVIRKVKYAACRHFGKKNLKVGHAGTLDPLATGILLVCIGPATRRAEELQRSAKEYVAGISFGATTPSFDLEKEIDRFFPTDGVSEESIRAALPAFLGEQDQMAPLFSAKSVDGVRAYETARKLYKQGLPVADTDILQANRITIYDLELLRYSPLLTPPELPLRSIPLTSDGGSTPVASPASSCSSMLQSQHARTAGSAGALLVREGESLPSEVKRNERIHVADISGTMLPSASIRIACSKGTYIRAFARDLGEALGTGAFLNSLRRTQNGGFSIEDAIPLAAALSSLS